MAELVHKKCGCGEFPVTKHEHDNWITECRCGMNTGWHDGQADAREAWNRALRGSSAAEIEAVLRELVDALPSAEFMEGRGLQEGELLKRARKALG